MKEVATAWRTWDIQSFQVHLSILLVFFGKIVVYYRHCMECLPIFFFKEFTIMGGHRFNYRFPP